MNLSDKVSMFNNFMLSAGDFVKNQETGATLQGRLKENGTVEKDRKITC